MVWDVNISHYFKHLIIKAFYLVKTVVDSIWSTYKFCNMKYIIFGYAKIQMLLSCMLRCLIKMPIVSNSLALFGIYYNNVWIYMHPYQNQLKLYNQTTFAFHQWTILPTNTLAYEVWLMICSLKLEYSSFIIINDSEHITLQLRFTSA